MRDSVKTTISTNIRECVCRKTGRIMYEAKKFSRCKSFETIKEAKKYVDFVCVELGKEQVYNTFKRI